MNNKTQEGNFRANTYREKEKNLTPKPKMKNTTRNGNCGENTYREKEKNPAPYNGETPYEKK
jgi:hypothetical protein